MIQERTKLEFPYNFIQDVSGARDEGMVTYMENHPSDIEESVRYVVDTYFSEEEKKWIKMYYEEGMSLSEIAHEEKKKHRRRPKEYVEKEISKVVARIHADIETRRFISYGIQKTMLMYRTNPKFKIE